MTTNTHRPSTDTTGREQNSAEAPDTLTTQACVDTNAPLLSAALCSAVGCWFKTLKERVWGMMQTEEGMKKLYFYLLPIRIPLILVAAYFGAWLAKQISG